MVTLEEKTANSRGQESQANDEYYACQLRLQDDQDCRTFLSNAFQMQTDPFGLDGEASASISGQTHNSLPDAADPVKEDLDLRAFGNQVWSQRCHSCKKVLLPDATAVIDHTARLVSSAQDVADHYRGFSFVAPGPCLHSFCWCVYCRVLSCMGCGHGRQIGSERGPQGRGVGSDSLKIELCCTNGRLFLIWALLCGTKQPPGSPRSAARSTRSIATGRFARLGSSGISFGKGKDKAADKPPIVLAPEAPPESHGAAESSAYWKAPGIGYGGHHDDIYPVNVSNIKALSGRRLAQHSPPSLKPKEMSLEDKLLGQYFNALAHVLPSLEKTHELDYLPSPLVVTMLRRSPLLEKAAELFRNDSLEEILPQYELYGAVLNFVKVAGHHPTTAPAISTPRWDLPADRTLAFASSPAKSDVTAASSSGPKNQTQLETLQPLVTVIRSLGKQARRMLRHSALGEADFSTADGQKLINLCRKVCEVADFCEANLLDDVVMTGTSMTEDQRAAEYQQWHRDNAVSEILDEELMKTFCFAQEASKLHGAVTIPGRMKKLVSEVSSFQSSLPEGVYVRHGSSRLDVMKVLIVGPKSTPYENGLFEFDLYCPGAYPSLPPQMRFKTTGHSEGSGRGVRFNPNLYEDGKGRRLRFAYLHRQAASKEANNFVHSMPVTARDLARGTLETGPVHNPPGAGFNTVHGFLR
jgi:hypothetical protein